MKPLSTRLFYNLVLAFASLTVVSVMATSIASSYSEQVHSFLGTKPYREIEEGEVPEEARFPIEYDNPAKLAAHYNKACEQIEGEGLVLLRNDHDFLPLSHEAKVSLFLTGSANPNCSEQGERKATDKNNFLGLKEALEAKRVGKVKVNPDLYDFYRNGEASSYGGYKQVDNVHNVQVYTINEAPYSLYPNSLRNTFSQYGDAAIFVISRDSNEGSDLSAAYSDGEDGNYLALSEEEREMLVEISKLKEQGLISGIVCLLNGAAPLQLDFLDDPQISIDSCLYIGNFGSAGAYAVADALVGNITPSGKLPDTFCKDNFSSPAMASWVQNENREFARKYDANGHALSSTQSYYGVYSEGVYVGYRYYETRYEDVVMATPDVGDFDYEEVVAYPFGYGLSYTSFSYSSFEALEEDDGFLLSATVTNDGLLPGKETVQAYVQKPYGSYAKLHGIEVPSVELAGFAKTKELSPGESEKVSIHVEKSALASYDAYEAGTYILNEGNYYLALGKDSHSALNSILAKKGYTIADGMDEAGDPALVYDGFSLTAVDQNAFSVSEETGKAISNQLDSSDLNLYEGKGDNSVTYVSRKDWNGTFPKEKIQIKVTDQMAYDLQSDHPVEDQGGEMPKFSQERKLTLADLKDADLNDPRWQSLLDQMSFDEMNRLVSLGLATTEFIESVQKPATNGADSPTAIRSGERNLTNVRFPNEGIWAASFNKELVKQVGEFLARDVISNQADAFWAPGMNIHRTPYGGRIHEYFSEDPFLTGIMAEEEIKGIQSKGVIAYPKHFALNDEESRRGGISIWACEQEIREIILAPWKYACSPKRGNAHGIMSSFNRVGAVWSSANYGMVTSILREEFGFEGIVLTDMVSGNGASYMTSLDGIMGGTNLWYSASLKDSTLQPYANNVSVVMKMRESCHYILFNYARYSLVMDGYFKAISVTVWWQYALYSMIGVFASLTALSIAFYIIGYTQKRKMA